ncbi:hypothetical protein CDL12_28408 [Handroanthus impetiginosus]|uniref:TF-B3 domain-containing protein n=1 Tax=Handroanthus impetiginosus TaxID=429701 RepID=A0A2G9G1A0_9LAMI|nr:hypothetical protein CDL12_28408 [Handroanthus impetiginosus]
MKHENITEHNPRVVVSITEACAILNDEIGPLCPNERFYKQLKIDDSRDRQFTFVITPDLPGNRVQYAISGEWLCFVQLHYLLIGDENKMYRLPRNGQKEKELFIFCSSIITVYNIKAINDNQCNK